MIGSPLMTSPREISGRVRRFVSSFFSLSSRRADLSSFLPSFGPPETPRFSKENFRKSLLPLALNLLVLSLLILFYLFAVLSHSRSSAINLQLTAALKTFAAKRGIPSAQLALAYLLKLSENIIPIPGSSHIKRTLENVEAANVTFSDEEFNEIDAILKEFPGVGERCE